ncbi:hypothetical protein [Flagellimonas sp.]|uniref:hypothetical protein n=1 Tax=Flagellimonas sp. TaxID=2058762 RepID=UPI003BA8A94C
MNISNQDNELAIKIRESLKKEIAKEKELELRISKIERTIMTKYHLKTKEEYLKWVTNKS